MRIYGRRRQTELDQVPRLARLTYYLSPRPRVEIGELTYDTTLCH